jgi:hypothetical protein
MKIIVTKKGIRSIEKTAREMLRFPEERKWDSADKDERFRSLFGAPSLVIAALWELIRSQVNYGVEEKHLLWGLVFLKVYAKNEETHCSIVGFPTKQEFREKAWHIVNIIADLKDGIIRLENRFINSPNNMVGRPYLTGDCSDFKINEPFPFHTKWCSPKFRGPGMKYEVCLAIYSPNICWSNGPHYASASEGTIFKTGLGMELPADEPVEVDAGVKGDPRLMRPLMGVTSLARKQKSVYRARQESIFSRMKQFNVLDTHFHHTCTEEVDYMKKHQICFDSVLVITQLKLVLKVDKLMDVGEIDEVEYVMT